MNIIVFIGISVDLKSWLRRKVEMFEIGHLFFVTSPICQLVEINAVFMLSFRRFALLQKGVDLGPSESANTWNAGLTSVESWRKFYSCRPGTRRISSQGPEGRGRENR
jgi:hypothetical protein